MTGATKRYCCCAMYTQHSRRAEKYYKPFHRELEDDKKGKTKTPFCIPEFCFMFSKSLPPAAP